MYVWYNCSIDWFKHIINVTFIVVSAFVFKKKVSYFVLSSLSIFLDSKTIVVTNLKPFNSDNKSISLFVITDSVSLSCSSGLKEISTSTLQELA